VASTIANEFREAQTVIIKAIQQSTTDIAQTLEATLKKSLSSGLLTPFEKFVNDIKDQCSKTALEAKQISLQLKQAQRIHIGGYALGAMVLTLVLTAIIWLNAARHYSEREEQLIQKIDQNRQVLSALARKGTTLKVQRDRKDSSRLYLIIEHASAWTADQNAVVEVK
jgi:tRNA(Met) C34 N-acetyltransferase TmcA